MYIRQQSLLSFENIIALQPKTKLELIFENIDLSEATKLLPRFGRGPKGYDLIPIVRALLAQQIEQIPTRAALVRRLVTDPVLRYACGFNIIGKVPSEATFSRYFNILNENGFLQKIYFDLVDKAMELGLMDTKVIAIDATDLTSYERVKPKKKLNSDDPNTPDWGSKMDSHGNQKTWVGWKLHLAVDNKSELPLAFMFSKASKADGEFAIPLVDQVYEQCKAKEYELPQYWTMDSGYDWKRIYEEIYNTYIRLSNYSD
ncbi:transposase [Anoxybacter fermentans]|uniref:transposase n=1 Tax=Anoxybacter fermentans TaxID=1323375 RepID=UPI00196B2555|nr:transposase [Anoxybacter fermentans]